MDFDQAIKQLQDTLVVVTGIQQRQAEVLKGQSQWLEQHARVITLIREGQELHEQQMRKFDETMIEIEDKLNGLIGYLDHGKS